MRKGGIMIVEITDSKETLSGEKSPDFFLTAEFAISIISYTNHTYHTGRMENEHT
jgi:hypothetical protein